METKLNEVIERLEILGYNVISKRLNKDENGYLGHISIGDTWISGRTLKDIEQYFEIHAIRINTKFNIVTITITDKNYKH